MSSLVHVFEAIASAGDFLNAANAPLNTDGASATPNALEQRVDEILNALRKPAASVKDLVCIEHFAQPAVLDAIENANGIGIDDRLLLLEDALVLMSRSEKLCPELSSKLQQSVISLLYKDLPHPPRGYLAQFDPLKPSDETRPDLPFPFRSADGSNYNPAVPSLGKAGSPYARSVPPTHVNNKHNLPDPGLLFDHILRRKEFVPHPGGISSLFFAFANLVIHSIFDTDHHDPTKNSTSSYLDLSILYGNSESDVNQVRRLDGSGKLWNDVFSDSRLLLMPPASCALLVLLNRNHNHIAQQLLEINENQNYSWPPKTEEDRVIQDEDIFQRTRLINCAFFMNIILGDYVGAILGLVADGSDWRLDPLMDTRDPDHSVSSRGEGNVVSVEFNLLYRWHATLSEQDATWTDTEFKKFFGKQDLSKVTTQDFITVAHKALIPDADLKKRTFGGLQRQPDGRFKDDDLAKIIQDATDWRAASYSSGCPEALRVIEILGIEQARGWGTCSHTRLSLNGIPTHVSMLVVNHNPSPDPLNIIQEAAATLYNNDIDNLELYLPGLTVIKVGLQAEECKKPGPGAGLCPGYTISRAILADAVALTRGDPYLTNEFNTQNFTQWGYDDVQYDKKDGSYGGLLTKLLFRTLPDNYPVGSGYAHFPFLVPGYMEDKNPAIRNKYYWKRPDQITSRKTVEVNTYPAAKEVLENPSFLSAYKERLFKIVSNGPDSHLSESILMDDLVDESTKVQKLVFASSSPSSWTEYFRKETHQLINDKSTQQSDHSRTVDIVRDVINLLPVHWISEQIFGLPLKSQDNPRGVIYENAMYEYFAALGRYVFSDVIPENDWHLRIDADNAFETVFPNVKGHFDEIMNKYSFSSFSRRVSDFVDHAVKNKQSSFELISKIVASYKDSEATSSELAAYAIAAVIPTSAYFSQAIAQIVDFYLADDKQQERAEIISLSASIGQNSNSAAKVLAYAREALRANPPVSGVFRTAGGLIPVAGFGTVEVGSRVTVNLLDANRDGAASHGLLWNETGLLSPNFFEATVPVIVGTILSLKNIRRTAGDVGTLSGFQDKWTGVTRELYFDAKGKVTPLPPSLRIDFGKKA
ncbi:hypothetical protein H0H93_016224 [Arthromyces matolae]|nr:hypothetical protein H0H93_016224 [Arthromyces matolae]